MGIELAPTDRGGDITYHGPGQLVVYPILDLNRLGLRIHPYLRLLDETDLPFLVTMGALLIVALIPPPAVALIGPLQSQCFDSSQPDLVTVLR